MEHLLKESNIKKSRLFCFHKHFNVIVLEALYVHGAEVFAMLLSFNKCSISAWTAPIYFSVEYTL